MVPRGWGATQRVKGFRYNHEVGSLDTQLPHKGLVGSIPVISLCTGGRDRVPQSKQVSHTS